MEVLMGPSFSIEVSSPPTYVVPPPPENSITVAPRLFLDGGSEDGIGMSGSGTAEDDSSDSSSSIGAPDDSGDEEELNDTAVSSKAGLGSLDSLEDSLPIKRGLSNHFSGKSKSFANLTEVSSASNMKEVEKQENPFNKRRRILMANKWSRRSSSSSSLYNWPNPKSMPLLTLNEEEEKEEPHQEQDHHSSDDEEKIQEKPRLLDGKFKTSFKSYSYFSLTDLQEQHQ